MKKNAHAGRNWKQVKCNISRASLTRHEVKLGSGNDDECEPVPSNLEGGCGWLRGWVVRAWSGAACLPED